MSARDELAELLYATLAVDHDDSTLVVGYTAEGCATWGKALGECKRVADAILAAGWRAPLPSAPDCNHRGRWRAGACVDCGVQCEHRHVTHAKRCGTCGESQLTFDEALERAHRLSGW